MCSLAWLLAHTQSIRWTEHSWSTPVFPTTILLTFSLVPSWKFRWAFRSMFRIILRKGQQLDVEQQQQVLQLRRPRWVRDHAQLLPEGCGGVSPWTPWPDSKVHSLAFFGCWLLLWFFVHVLINGALELLWSGGHCSTGTHFTWTAGSDDSGYTQCSILL